MSLFFRYFYEYLSVFDDKQYALSMKLHYHSLLLSLTMDYRAPHAFPWNCLIYNNLIKQRTFSSFTETECKSNQIFLIELFEDQKCTKIYNREINIFLQFRSHRADSVFHWMELLTSSTENGN